MKTMTWRQWFHGLFAAVVGSFGNLGSVGVAGYFMDYDLTDWGFWKPCIASAVVTGWAGVQFYIKQFPPLGTVVQLSVSSTSASIDVVK